MKYKMAGVLRNVNMIFQRETNHLFKAIRKEK